MGGLIKSKVVKPRNKVSWVFMSFEFFKTLQEPESNCKSLNCIVPINFGIVSLLFREKFFIPFCRESLHFALVISSTYLYLSYFHLSYYFLLSLHENNKTKINKNTINDEMFTTLG